MRRSQHPEIICRWLGHKRESYIGRYRTGRDGRQFPLYYSRCTRCGTSDGATVFEHGHLERFKWWNIKVVYWRMKRDTMKLLWSNCHDCGKAEMRFFRPVGDHSDCVPF
jgi:hypothetical protein